MQNCPWCGKHLETKYLDIGHSIRYVCARCGYKIKDIAKPEPKREEPKPQVVEIQAHEIPNVKQTPAWPYIVGAVVLILIIIVLVKIFLV